MPIQSSRPNFTRFYEIRLFEAYWFLRRFGIDKRKAHFSSMIKTNQMSREEALLRISKPEMDEQFLQKEFEYVAHKVDLAVEKLQKFFDMPKRTYRDYKNKRKLIGLGIDALRFLRLEKRYFK